MSDLPDFVSRVPHVCLITDSGAGFFIGDFCVDGPVQVNSKMQ